MKLFFIRHGETNSNLQKRGVSFNDKLTETGCKQAQNLANIISDIPIDIILTSPHKRTKKNSGNNCKKN